MSFSKKNVESMLKPKSKKHEGSMLKFAVIRKQEYKVIGENLSEHEIEDYDLRLYDVIEQSEFDRLSSKTPIAVISVWFQENSKTLISKLVPIFMKSDLSKYSIMKGSYFLKGSLSEDELLWIATNR